MKHLLKALFATLFLFGLFYLLIALYFISFDLRDFSEGGRYILSVCGLVCIIIGSGFYFIHDESK